MSHFDLENEVNSALKMDAPLTRGPLMRWQRKNADPGNQSLNSSVANASLTSSSKTPMKLVNQPSMGQPKTPSADTGRKTPKSSAGTHKTPSKTSKTPKKTPKAGDRFIPNRTTTQFDVGHFKLSRDAEAECEASQELLSPSQVEYQRLMSENLNGDRLNHKIISYKEKAPGAPEGYQSNLKVLYSSTKAPASAKKTTRHIPQIPERILDAPDILDDYYLNLLDWSNTNLLAVSLGGSVYLWNASTGEITQLLQMEGPEEYVGAVSWIKEGNYLAVGTRSGEVQLWDVVQKKRLRNMAGHSARVGCLSWNSYIVSSGSRSGNIHHHDVRMAEHHVGTLSAHTQEVCGLNWSPDGKHLASGANDNLLCIWPAQTVGSVAQPLYTFTQHQAAVKAVSWCPWQPSLLASGGGTADRHIRFWNCNTGTSLNAIDTKSQVCAILWSREHRELISSHGFAQNQLIIWKYPTMSKVAELTEASSSTKVRVEELLQQVVSQSTKEAAEVKKRKKKKTKETDENTVLESLRKGSEITGLHKDEDTALLANIYEPDNSPKNEKSNKQRQRKQQQADAESFKTLKDNIEIAELDKKKVKKKKNVEETSLSFPADKILELPPADSFKTPIPKERKKNKTKNMTEPPDITIADPEIPDSPTKISKKKKKEELMEKEVLPDAEKPLPERSKQKKKQTPDAKILNKDTSEADTTMLSPKAVKKKKKKPDELQSSDKEDLQPIHKQDGLSENVMTSPRQKKKKKAKESEPPEEVKPSSSDPSVIPSSEDKKKKKAGSKMSAEAEEKKVSEETQESAEGDATGKKKAKKKRVKAKDGAGDAGVEAEKIEEAPADIPDAGEVLAVMIHRTDKLKNDFNILHPLVRVHIVDENTGQHFPKQHKERAVTSFYETSHDKVDCVLPIMTQPFDFKERKSTIPAWEELLIFNENYNHFIQTTPKALILFEILDFTSMNSTNNRQETGWYHIAWAFLKIVGANDKINVGSRARLQLYQVPPRRITKRDQVEPYQWWKMPKRDPYPSTLYVTLKNTTPPLVVEPSMRSMFATQKEQGAMTYEDLKRSMNWDTKNNRLETRPITTWTRLFGQLCRIPNDLILTLPGLRKGCFVICFSHDGRTLACACGDRDGNPILLYEIPSGKQRMELKGHFSLVYELSWSKKDTHLASASSDGTVRIWNVIEAKPFAEKVLPHPSFVYCCKFHPRVDTVVVSGCYDQVIRVWDISQEEESGQLVQEIEGHLGHVNSLCFNDDDGQKMYSADNTGRINIWNVFVTEETGRRSFIRDWTLYSSLEEPELKGVSISRLELHPTGRRLLVHCRDNAIRMLDLRVQRVMQQYIGAINFREKLGSCMTPCGTFVFAGSEDGYVYAWNTDTGDQVARYTELNYHKPVTDVAYHPRDHIIAMCSLGENQPILVYKYDPFTAQVDAGVTSRGPVETTEVEDLVTGRKSPLLDEGELLSARSKVMTQDEFQAHETARYQRVMKKLESATMHMSQMPGMVTPDTSHRFDSIGRSGAVSSWSATDSGSYIATPRSNMPSPGLMSPHAPQTALTTLQSQQLTLQNRYLKQSDSGWRPTYSEVGRHGSKAPVIYGRPPHISLDTSGGKAQFSFQSPLGSTKKHTKCVVLYDYRAQRSDELTIFRGDIVLLLYKDSDTWWMGELENGQQGFFPANYVTFADEDDKGPSNDKGKHTYTAVKTKDGDLKFLSGAEDEDSEAEAEPLSSSLAKNRGGGKTTKKVHYAETS